MSTYENKASAVDRARQVNRARVLRDRGAREDAELAEAIIDYRERAVRMSELEGRIGRSTSGDRFLRRMANLGAR